MKSKQLSAKNEVVSFRLSSEDFAPFAEKLAKSNMTRSEFFREIFINANVNLTINELPDKDYTRLLFYYNKSGNNLNQLAYFANSAVLNGQVSEALCQKLLYQLNTIREILLSGVNYHVD